MFERVIPHLLFAEEDHDTSFESYYDFPLQKLKNSWTSCVLPTKDLVANLARFIAENGGTGVTRCNPS